MYFYKLKEIEAVITRIVEALRYRQIAYLENAIVANRLNKTLGSDKSKHEQSESLNSAGKIFEKLFSSNATDVRVHDIHLLEQQGTQCAMYSFFLTYISEGSMQQKEFILRIYEKERRRSDTKNSHCSKHSKNTVSLFQLYTTLRQILILIKTIDIYCHYDGMNDSMSNTKRKQHPAEPARVRARSPLSYLLSHPKHVLGIIKRRMQFLTALESWFLAALNKQAWEQKQGWGPSGNYYEFGVGWGGTLMAYIKALSLFCRENRRNFYKYHIFGFDSFEGLPEKKGFQDDHTTYWKGAFSHSVDEINEKIREYGIDLKQGNIHLIKGFFEDSLTSELRNKLKKWPPSIVTIDVDYYSSTKIVLEWLGPILPSGALFYFDDVWDFHGHPDYGELYAINEFNKIGIGQLVPFAVLGMAGQAYIFSRKDFEYVCKRYDSCFHPYEGKNIRPREASLITL